MCCCMCWLLRVLLSRVLCEVLHGISTTIESQHINCTQALTAGDLEREAYVVEEV